MKILKLFYILNFIFNPFKNLSYYSQYYQIVEQIIIHKNKRIIWGVKLLLLIILIKSFHFAFLAFVHSSQTLLDHSLHFDILWLITGKLLINFFAFLAAYLLSYLIYCLLLDVDLFLIKILYQTLILNDPFHFFSSFVVGDNLADQKASFDNCVYIRKYFILILSLLHMYTVAASEYYRFANRATKLYQKNCDN